MDYQIDLKPSMLWLVGYHIEKEELFLYTIDEDDVISVYARGYLDVIGFREFLDFSHVEFLGAL